MTAPPTDGVPTDRFGRRAVLAPDDGFPDTPVGFYTPEGRRLWERLQARPPATAVTSEEFARLAGPGGAAPGSSAGAAADARPARTGTGTGTEPDIDTHTDTEPDTDTHVEAGTGEADRPPEDGAPSTDPGDPSPWQAAPHRGRPLAAWRLSGRGSLGTSTTHETGGPRAAH